MASVSDSTAEQSDATRALAEGLTRCRELVSDFEIKLQATDAEGFMLRLGEAE